MDILLLMINKLTSSLTLPLTFALVIVYVLRKLGKNKDRNHFINVMNRKLRNVHKPMGIALAIISITHGIASQTPVFWGIVCAITIVLLGLNFMFRKNFTKPNWLKVHRYLTIIMLLTLFLHLNESEDIKSEKFENYKNIEIRSN